MATYLSDGSTEGNVLGFVDVWSAQSQYTQGVTIPAGNYTLEISYYNAGGTGAIGKNLMGFISEDGTEYLGSNMSFETGKWIKEKIRTTKKQRIEERQKLLKENYLNKVNYGGETY